MHIENKEHAIPAIIIVVNFGVSGCHLKVVANIAKPIEQNKPKVQPKNVPAYQSFYPSKNIPNMKKIKAEARPKPPIKPDIPTLLKLCLNANPS